MISPYARTHVVSHAEGDHNAIIETINAIFDLPALSSLPDEAAALAAGNSVAFNKFADGNAPAGFTQKFLGPRDTNSSITDSLLSAFDPRRLQGTAPALPASYAMIPDATVKALPHLRCPRLSGDRRGPRRPAAGPFDAAARQLQLAAIDFAGLQHSGSAIETAAPS